MITGEFLFGIQSCEYSNTPKGEKKLTRILQKGGIQFYRKHRELPHESGIFHLSDKAYPTSRTQKKGVKNTTVTQLQTAKNLCPVGIWLEILIILNSYPGTTRDTLLNTVWVEHHKTSIPSQMKDKYLRSGTPSFGKDRLVFSHKGVGTHSLRSGFAMELFLYKVYPETIIIMGLWDINALLYYIHIQVSNLRTGIITLMTSRQSLYTIPKA